jgi:hypothetical protein
MNLEYNIANTYETLIFSYARRKREEISSISAA